MVRCELSLGAFKVMRGVLQPGFKWSEHIKPLVQTDSCQVEHNAILLSGRIKTVMEDGSEMEIGPGDAYVTPPGHDAWVVGDETAVGIEFSREAVEDWGKEAGVVFRHVEHDQSGISYVWEVAGMSNSSGGATKLCPSERGSGCGPVLATYSMLLRATKPTFFLPAPWNGQPLSTKRGEVE
jgi:hypothetical protein